MDVKVEEVNTKSFRLTAYANGGKETRFMHFIYNDLHEEPYALLKNEGSSKDSDLGRKVLQTAISKARAEGCYKVLTIGNHARKYQEFCESSNFFEVEGGLAMKLEFSENKPQDINATPVEGSTHYQIDCFPSTAYRVSVVNEEGEEMSRASFYPLIEAEKASSLLEDVFTYNQFRKQGLGDIVVNKVLHIANEQGVSEIVLNSEKPFVQAWYRRLGFEDNGNELRLDL